MRRGVKVFIFLAVLVLNLAIVNSEELGTHSVLLTNELKPASELNNHLAVNYPAGVVSINAGGKITKFNYAGYAMNVGGNINVESIVQTGNTGNQLYSIGLKRSGTSGSLTYPDIYSTDGPLVISGEACGASGCLNNGGIVAFNGKVGVGTSSPVSKFHVENTLDASQNGADKLSILVRRDAIDAGTGPGIGFSADNTPSIGAKIVHIRTSSNSQGDLAFYTKSTTGSEPTEKLRIKDSGSVGIGTASPSALLHTYLSGSGSGDREVAKFQANGGNPYITLGTVPGGYVLFDDSNKVIRIDTHGSAGGLFVKAGNVGVGTANPQAKLDIGPNSNVVQRWTASGGRPYGIEAYDNRFILADLGVRRVLEYDPAGWTALYGSVGIGGTPSSGTTLDVAGILNANYLSLDPQDGAAEGGEIRLTGAASNPTIHLDNYAGNFRVHTLQPGKNFEIIGGGLCLSGDCRTAWPAATAEQDPTVNAAVKDGVSWSEVSGIPAGFADGVDDVGTGGIASETDPQVSTLTNGKWCMSDGIAVQCDQNAPINSQWTTTGSNIYYNTGNVGIGTNNPSRRFEVNGGTLIKAYGGATFEVTGDAGVVSLFAASGGNVGIGTNNPAAKLHIKQSTDGTVNSGLYLQTSDLFAGGIFRNAGQFGAIIVQNNGIDTLAIKNGNVGIGTNDPTQKLDVAGTVNTQGFTVKATNPKIILMPSTGGTGTELSFKEGTQSQKYTELWSSGKLVLNGYGGVIVYGATEYMDGVKPNYDSGWFAVTSGNDYTKAHGLGVVPKQFMLWQCDGISGNTCLSRVVLAGTRGYQDGTSAINPVTVSADTSNIYIGLYSAWAAWGYWSNSAPGNKWVVTSNVDSNAYTAYYRVFAWK